MNSFPLLTEINEDLHSENLDWNRNAFQTLLVSAQDKEASSSIRTFFFLDLESPIENHRFLRSSCRTSTIGKQFIRALLGHDHRCTKRVAISTVLCSCLHLSFSLSQYLFNLSIDQETEAYIYEAKCQLLMYASIAMIKMNTIVRGGQSPEKEEHFLLRLFFSETSIDA